MHCTRVIVSWMVLSGCTHASLLSQDLSATLISAWRKEQLRTQLKALKKSVDDMDWTRKAQLVQNVCVCLCVLYACVCVYVLYVHGVCVCERERCVRACNGAMLAICELRNPSDSLQHGTDNMSSRAR